MHPIGLIPLMVLAAEPARSGPVPDLETPQSSLESFVDAGDRGDWALAARSLDLSALPAGRRAVDGPDLARRLKAVMDAQVWFRWDEVPDRPDGRDDDEPGSPHRSPIAAEGGAVGHEGAPPPRSNFKLYDLSIGDRDYEIRLGRVDQAGGPAAWLFTRQTVAHIPALFEHFGPSRLERSIPSWMKRLRFFKVALWQWVGFALIVGAGVAVGALGQRAFEAATAWMGWDRGKAIAEATRGPGALTLGLWAIHELATRYLGLARPIAGLLEPFYLALMTAAVAWTLHNLIGRVAARLGRRYEAFNNDEGNAAITRLLVLRHALTTVVVIGGILMILGRFAWFRQVGTTLLASAGVAGVVLGVAAQRVLGNLFAGLVLAITQPVKAGDAVLFEGEFGWIEEIDVTYLVIRSWDLRRLVVPIAYFLDKPFQNWSRGSQQIIKPVTIHADYGVDLEALRAEVPKILESSEDWDREFTPKVEVVACGADSIELRVLCSAQDPATAWRLHCLLRERLVAALRDLDGGRTLPRRRVAVVNGAVDGVAGGAEA